MTFADLWMVLDRAGFETMRALFSVLWQSSILLGAVGLLALALRRRSAAARQTIWAVAIVLTPLLPILAHLATSAAVPQAPIPVMPEYAAPQPVIPVAPPPMAPVRAWSPLDYPWAMALLAYAAGAAALMTLVLVGRFRIGRWLRRGRVATDAGVLAVFESARTLLALQREFTVVESAAVRAPLTIGTLHPAVLLPTGFAAGLSQAELQAVAIHELSHVARRDAPLLAILSCVRAALWFHPLVWLACRQVATLAEQACDDRVLEATGEPVSYARLLARLAEELPRRALGMELAAGVVFSKGALLKRVEAILSHRRDQIRRLSRAALVATVLGAIVSVAVALALPLADKPPPAEAEKAAAPAGAKASAPESPAAGPAENASGTGKAMDDVYIMGGVGRPGVYSVANQKLTLLQLLAAAGYRPENNDDTVMVIRKSADGRREEQQVLDINAIIAGKAGNIFLQSGDVVVVRPRLSAQQQERLKELKAKEMSLVAETENLRGKFGPNHRAVLAAQEQLKAIRSKIVELAGAATPPAAPAGGQQDAKANLMNWVEDFFSKNYRDITARQTLEWGEVQKEPSGNLSIRYKYRATIRDKDKFVIEEQYTFGPDGQFVSVKSLSKVPAVAPAPANRPAGLPENAAAQLIGTWRELSNPRDLIFRPDRTFELLQMDRPKPGLLLVGTWELDGRLLTRKITQSPENAARAGQEERQEIWVLSPGFLELRTPGGPGGLWQYERLPVNDKAIAPAN
jgi:beta-lactamase regulating signal transducer with metallopeptidase domain